MKEQIIFSLLLLLLIFSIDSVYSDSIPNWVKNTAGWWASDAISETEFVNAIEFLIKYVVINVKTR